MIVPLFVGILLLIIGVSSTNMMICSSTILAAEREVQIVGKSFARVEQIAVANNIVRTLLNLANDIEPNESFLTDDRDTLYREKLNRTIEDLRTTQNELNVAYFRFSQAFYEALHEHVPLQSLGEYGD